MMKKTILTNYANLFVIVILILSNCGALKAQHDVLDLCAFDEGKDDCLITPDITIPVNYDASGPDTSVILSNFSGYRLLNPTVPDKQYKFCAANVAFCGTTATNPGEFHIKFKYNSLPFGVKKINFRIYNNSGGTITVTAYQGAVASTVSGIIISGGRKYVCEDTSTPFDSIRIVSSFNSVLSAESQLFVLDSLIIPAVSTNLSPTDMSLSSNTIDENAVIHTAIGTFSSTDPNPGDTHTYSLVSGTGDTDNASFTIAGNTLQSNAVFNYEVKSSYSIRVQTDDGHGGTYQKQFIINVNDIIETSSFTIVAISDVSIGENSAYTSVTPNIADAPVGSVTYSLGGTDAGDFTIDSPTGIVSMVARDYENPADADANNVYQLTITATDADGNLDSEDWTVTVNDVIEPATFTIDPVSDVTINENTAYTSVTPHITGTPVGSVTYALGGADGADFTINPSTGVVSMIARDYENPADADANNVYQLTITATDADGNFDSEDWTVNVSNVTETVSIPIDPVSDVSVNENTAYTSVTPHIAGTPVGSVTYALGGADGTDFTINPSTGVVSMIARDYESPADADVNNVYQLTITATDADGNFDSEDWTVTVNDVIEPVTFTIDPISNVTINENTAYTSVTPHITGTPVGSVTYSLGGADGADFTINPSTGVVSMIARDYEGPVDADANNVYQLTITATDADGNSDNEDWTVTVANIVDGPPEVVCLLDLSYSMNRDFNDINTSNPDEVKLNHAKSALIAFSDLLYSFNPGSASLGLARFPNSPQIGCDAGSIKLLRTLDVTYNTEMATDIPLLTADGYSTPLLAGIDFAITMFNSDNNKIIVLLSDGRQNCPTSAVTSTMTGASISALNAAGIKLYTIGFGATSLVPNSMLDTLASRTGGVHYNIDAVSDKSPAYDPAAPGTWNPATALHAAYANIMVAGLSLNPCTDPLDIISRGAKKQFKIPVTVFDDRVCFFVSWVTPRKNNLGVTLYAPNGKQLLLKQPGIIVMQRNNHTIITLTKSILNKRGMTGTWKLAIDASKIEKPSEYYQYSVINASKELRLHTWFDKEKYFTGDKMKIHFELLLEGKRLTRIDKIAIKGTRPGEGLGTWLASKKVDEKLLERLSQKQMDEYLKWITALPAYEKLNKESKQQYYSRQKEIFRNNIDPVQLRASVLKNEYKLAWPRRVIIDGLQFNDDGKGGDEKAGDGIYTAVHVPLKEGSYQFYVSVEDSGKGTSIKREGQLQQYVHVRINPKAFVEKISPYQVLRGETIYKINLKLKDNYGNVPAPTALGEVKLSVNKGRLIGGISANPDGTFTQNLLLPTDVKLREVTITMTFGNETGKQRLGSGASPWITGSVGTILLLIGGLVARKKLLKKK